MDAFVVNHWFKYHEPSDPDVASCCKRFRNLIGDAAEALNESTPDGEDKLVAMRLLRQAMQAGVMAIVVPPFGDEHKKLPWKK